MRLLSLIFLIFILFNPYLLSAQKNKLEREMIYKLRRAVLSIECLPNYYDENNSYYKMWRNGHINSERYSELSDSLQDSYRGKGTAIYLKYKDRFYLLTARHVLLYPNSKDTAAVAQRIFLSDNIESANKPRNKADEFGNILRGANDDHTFLMEYAAGTRERRPYVLSSDDDLGLISLETVDGYFFNETLEKRGYVPLNISDIDTLCEIKKNDRIISIGYPSAITWYNNKKNALSKYWDGWGVAIPAVSFGMIINEANDKNYFLGDIFVDHGNSGGPIFLNNKLIGVVSRFELDDQNVPVPIFIKSSRILPLLKLLEPIILIREKIYYKLKK